MQYDKLDSLIVKRIAAEPRFLSGLCSAEIQGETHRLAKAMGRDDFRVLDGRLQALKKKRAIKFDSKRGWVIETHNVELTGAARHERKTKP